jgi:hypothetical protein
VDDCGETMAAAIVGRADVAKLLPSRRRRQQAFRGVEPRGQRAARRFLGKRDVEFVFVGRKNGSFG